MNNDNKMNVNGPAGREEDTIDLLDLFFFLRSKLVYLLAALIVGLGVAGVYTKLCVTPTYQASSYLYMVSASSGSVVDLSDLNIGTAISDDYTALLVRRPVLENVAALLSDQILVEDALLEGEERTEEEKQEMLVLPTITSLAKYIDVSVLGKSRILKISVTTPFPKISRNIANTIVEQAVDYIPQIMNVTAPTIAEYAVTPKSKYSPSTAKNMIMGGLLALLLVGGIFTVIYLMDDTIKSSEDIEKYFGIIPLTVVPEADLGTSEEEKKLDEKHARQRRRRLGRFKKGGKGKA